VLSRKARAGAPAVKRGASRADPRLVAARRALLDESQNEDFPYTVRICRREFAVHRGVFSPKHFESTGIFSEILPYRRGDRLLEVGCGCGATAVLAALHGATRVVAVDITPEAVENTRVNVARHGLDAVVDVRIGDVFSSIRPGERFATIYWNIPLIYVPGRYRFRSALEQSVYDPGYGLAHRFLRDAPDVLEDGGRVLVGFATVGLVEDFVDLARAHRYEVREVARRAGRRNPAVEFLVYELTVRSSGGPAASPEAPLRSPRTSPTPKRKAK
jgi:release factor glutamine methyltransferase